MMFAVMYELIQLKSFILQAAPITTNISAATSAHFSIFTSSQNILSPLSQQVISTYIL